ncbi:MAG: helix-turn-helix transcriptional regulator [Anaerolineae bacterium]
MEEGTLYPLLRRLEQQGLLVSEWEVGEARPRKYYRISPSGREIAGCTERRVVATVDVMRAILRGGDHGGELVERYVHQIGRYLPPKERAEIEAELRSSQIEDQLEDRYGAAPTLTEIGSVLTELGEPRQLASSYNREQYLVGPELYPIMMTILRGTVGR